MTKYSYTAFGMLISSEFPLLLPLADEATPVGWLVEIVSGRVSVSQDLPHLLGKIRYGREGNSIKFDIPWVARYSLEGDSQIVVERIADANDDLTGLYLTSLLLAVMLRNRDVISLHGSAVSGPKSSIVFIGDKGSGKSTTAAAMTGFGYKMLCDDVIPIAQGPRVLPGIPLPRLLPDAYEKLVGNPQEALHLFDGLNKYQANLPSSHETSPLRMVFALETSEIPELRIEPIKGIAKIQAILQHAMFLEGVDDPALLFARISERLSSIPCFKVRRPMAKDCLDELVRDIIAVDGKGI